MTPTVSVIIPAYNAERFIARTIQSCLDQTVPPLEILVADDGSSDRTAEIVSSFPAPVRLLRKKNGGPASARNHAAREAKGDWLAMLDADDRWMPTKLERQLTFDVSPDIGVIHCLSACSREGVPAEVTFDHLWEQNWIVNSSVMIRRSVFESLKGFDEDPRLISVEDYNLWLRVAAAGWKIVTCQEILVEYTRGIGISSHTEKFFKACVNNVLLISEKLRIPQAKMEEKLANEYAFFGAAALFERNLPLARSAYRQAISINPSLRNLGHFAVSQLPSTILNARRGIAEKWNELTDQADPDRSHANGKEVEADFAGKGPFLLVIIDTEEEFDWRVVPSNSTSVDSMKFQERGQRIFEKFNLVPTYAVDYAIASQKDGYAPLVEYLADGRCEIGTHLHPWINPPIKEAMTARNSFPGNLPPDLEFEKLRVLTDLIGQNLEQEPILYRAGRYGLGPHTPEALKSLGYKIDCSVLPLFDLTYMEGPDFRQSRTRPYWLDADRALLELPVTVGIVGALSPFGRRLHPLISGPREESLRLPGIFARLNLINRVRLTPEGVPLREAKQLTRKLLDDDRQRVFVMSYHSPSLEPGNTPYVRSDKDLQRFLRWIEAYVEYFITELGGTPITPKQLLKEERALAGVQ